ncbi:kinase-like domain-containing protein, partial [Mycena galericulata]
ESYWRLRWSFFECSGYQLRPKFGPTFTKHLKDLDENALEEYKAYYSNRSIMDAQRVSDGKKVMFKRVSIQDHPDEVRIARLFSSPPHAGNPRNHCIPILEVLQDPLEDDKQILVMPLLITFSRPRFDTVGEVVNCFQQIFEGIQYMHENFVAHRDCGINNILQDPMRLFPDGFYPMRPWWDFAAGNFAHTITRTECWPRYYIIDFGLSRQYDPADGLPFEDVIRGGDKSPPEHKFVACNPFPTDIYFLGNLLKEKILYSRFLEPLVNDMIQPDPAQRPTIGQVNERFDELCRKLSSWHLR